MSRVLNNTVSQDNSARVHLSEPKQERLNMRGIFYFSVGRHNSATVHEGESTEHPLVIKKPRNVAWWGVGRRACYLLCDPGPDLRLRVSRTRRAKKTCDGNIQIAATIVLLP